MEENERLNHKLEIDKESILFNNKVNSIHSIYLLLLLLLLPIYRKFTRDSTINITRMGAS